MVALAPLAFPRSEVCGAKRKTIITKMSMQAVNTIRTKWSRIHPFYKGTLAYMVMWPSGSLIQQSMEGKNLKNYDWMRCLRYSLYGTFYVAPTFYCWMRLTSTMWPQMNFRVAVKKVLTEQVSYSIFATTSFFFVMSLIEGKDINGAVQETKDKFLPTYKTGLCYWPFVQTLNFSLIPERNRMIFVSVCGVLWTTFLACVKQWEAEANDEAKTEVLEIEDTASRSAEADD